MTDNPTDANGVGACAPIGDLTWREAHPADAAAISTAIRTWWRPGVRIVDGVCPQLLEHMGDTCLVVESREGLVGFLVGYMSQRLPDAGYVHFMGVRPDCRGRGVGRELYHRFAALTRQRGRRRVVAETGLWNKVSIAFHVGVGFILEPGDIVVDGLPGWRDATGVGCDYVSMVLWLDEDDV